MAALRYKDEHNKVGYLLKPTKSDDYHQIIDFLRASHIRSPELADDSGVTDLPIAEIYSGMDNLSTKSGSWDQFGGLIVVALICLSDGRRFNWSSNIFKGMFKHPNIASFSRSHETAAGTFTDMEDEPLGGSFHMSPLRSTQAPPAGQPSGGPEYPITLTTLSSLVSTLVQKVNSLETKLKDHKKLFKDVVGKLVKKVKAMEVKLKTKKRKMVMSDSDQEEGRKQDVDLDALHALANADVTVDSNISPGGIETRTKRKYKVLMFSSKLFANMRLNFEGHPMPLLPVMLLQAQAGQPSGGPEYPITLTTLSSVVSTLVQKVNSLETKLKDHKKLFKDVVGKLVKKVKAMEVKLKTKKRKMVMSDSDQEEGRK
nr:hypothetical protein [Tanacetum cinerariifolium]